MNVRRVGLVTRYEVVSMLRRRSFWFMTLVFPIMVVGLTVLPQVLAQSSVREVSSVVMSAGLTAPVRYVDAANIIREVPGALSGRLIRYESQADAEAALHSGKIVQYYLIPSDFRQSGALTAVSEHASPISDLTSAAALKYVVRYNLALGQAGSVQSGPGDGREAVAAAIAQPLARTDEQDVAPASANATATGSNQNGARLTTALLPFAMMFMLFFLITMSSGFMLQSVTREKESRTAELLLTCLSPRELMMGKVVGLGVVALLQMAIWLGGSQFLLVGGAVALVTAAGSGFSLGVLAWTLVFFILGYIVYAAALGAIGALAPNAREGSQFTFILMLPLLAPLALSSAFYENPDGALATALSLFPPSAPTAMITRLSSGAVPAWQMLVALAGMLVTAYLLVLLAARFFRADTLLSSQSLNWGRIAKELRGREPAG